MPRLAMLLSMFFFLTLAAASSAAEGTDKFTVEEAAPLPIAVAGHAGGLAGGRVVSVGGSSWGGTPRVKRWHRECFVLENKSWVSGPPLPEARSEMASAWGESGMYVCGGMEGTSETDQVLCLRDLRPDATWSALAPLPQSVQGARAALLKGILYVTCGTSQGQALNQLWSLDVARAGAKWKTCAPLPGAGRSHCGLAVLGDGLCLLGGFVLSPSKPGEIAIFDDAYRYDAGTDRWQRFEAVHFPGYAWAVEPLDANRVLLAGRVRALADIRAEIEVLDLNDGTAQTVGNLVGPTCCAPIVRAAPDRWYVFGGEPNAQRNRTAKVSLIQRGRTASR